MPDEVTSRNLGLVEQDGGEFYDINVVNTNLELVDSAVGRNNIILRLSNVVGFPSGGYLDTRITPNHRIVNIMLSNEDAHKSDWTYSVSAGKVTLSGQVAATTDLTIFMAEFYSATDAVPVPAPQVLKANILTKATSQHSFLSLTNTALDGSTIQIPSGADLDDYNIPGTYISANGDVTNSLAHCPEEINGNFKLWVNVNTGSASGSGGWWGCQIIQSGESLFIRTHAGNNGDTFGEWRRFDNRDLNNILATDFTWESAFTLSSGQSYCYINGRMLDLNVVSSNSATLANNTKIGTITTQAYRPWKDFCVSIFNWTSGKPINGSIWIYTNGNIIYYGDAISSSRLTFKATWII